jgi:hypothetical protein
MTPGEENAATQIRYWVWSGFHDREDVRAMLVDFLEDEADEGDVDPVVVEAMVEPAFDRKEAAEADWLDVTPCDLLGDAFADLNDAGICALEYAGYTMAEGHAEVTAEVAEDPDGEDYFGYCFYHGQDVERAVDGQGLSIAFGTLGDDDASGLEVGRVVTRRLRDAGFEVEWDGTLAQRIELPRFDWKRRWNDDL